MFFNFIYLFLAALGLCCCVRAFSSCSEWELLFVAVQGLLIAVASLVEHGLQARGLQSAGSVVVAHGLSCSATRGIIPDQGSNPCPLHWQADSQPLCHQGSPKIFFKKFHSKPFHVVHVNVILITLQSHLVYERNVILSLITHLVIQRNFGFFRNQIQLQGKRICPH